LYLDDADNREALAACQSIPTYTVADINALRTKFSDRTGAQIYTWEDDDYWPIIEAAVTKDADLINKISVDIDLDPRLLLSSLVVEQLRLYYTQRESVEKLFRPLQILATATKQAWGVMSIKEPIAIQTETHLRDAESPFYLGSPYEHLLDFTTDDPATERYQRITDYSDRYYAYLYGGLYIKQLLTQWRSAGYPIDHRPEIVATLYNLGFDKSMPKPDPQVGGSTLTINNRSYTFGGLAYEIYYSGVLVDEFPY